MFQFKIYVVKTLKIVLFVLLKFKLTLVRIQNYCEMLMLMFMLTLVLIPKIMLKIIMQMLK